MELIEQLAVITAIKDSTKNAETRIREALMEAMDANDITRAKMRVAGVPVGFVTMETRTQEVTTDEDAYEKWLRDNGHCRVKKIVTYQNLDSAEYADVADWISERWPMAVRQVVDWDCIPDGVMAELVQWVAATYPHAYYEYVKYDEPELIHAPGGQLMTEDGEVVPGKRLDEVPWCLKVKPLKGTKREELVKAVINAMPQYYSLAAAIDGSMFLPEQAECSIWQADEIECEVE